jgi:hypothetical protein
MCDGTLWVRRKALYGLWVKVEKHGEGGNLDGTLNHGRDILPTKIMIFPWQPP